VARIRLLHPSIVTGIVRTIKHDMIAGKMGELPASELHAVENKLREILAL
jgi:mRNA-degrading endonuclease toxin of MazEF toxin-antitoxin module